MIKKLIYTTLIFIFCLGIGTTCFGAKSWSVAEFETFMRNMGYGEIDLDTFSWVDTYGTLKSFTNNLSSTSQTLIILKGYEDGEYLSGKFTVLFPAASLEVGLALSSNEYFLDYTTVSSVSLVPAFIFNINEKTVNYSNNKKDYSYNPGSWSYDENEATEAEWKSTDYKTEIFKLACLYCEVDVSGTNYVFEGGAITSITSGDETLYAGSINYYNTTQKASITYTAGFEANTNYDIFLERYQLDTSEDNGIRYYPLETHNFGFVTTADTSVDINFTNWAYGSNNVYRLCIGIDTFDTIGRNEVFLATDWLVPNDNTFIKQRAFTRCHYWQPLSLIGFDANYEDEEHETGEDSSYEDDGSPLVYLYAGTALGGYIDDVNSVNINVKRKNNTIDINDYFLLLDIYDVETEKIIETITIESSGDVNIWGEPIDEEGLVYFVVLSDHYTFDASNNWYYGLRLHSYTRGFIDNGDAFYFDNKIASSPVGDFFSNLGTAIKNAIIDAFSYSSNPINGLFGLFSSKLSFIGNINSSITDMEKILMGLEEAPSISIDVAATKYTEARTIKIIDLSWYVPYKEYGDSILTGFIYICFLWRTFTHLPSIIGGVGGAVESGYYLSDINTYVHTGFGRGDGKRHQNLKK